MSGIGETSTSYPYLALSRRRGIDYGAVLRFVDWHKQECPDEHETRAQVLSDQLSLSDHNEIAMEYEKEMTRRRERA